MIKRKTLSLLIKRVSKEALIDFEEYPETLRTSLELKNNIILTRTTLRNIGYINTDNTLSYTI